MNGLPDPRHRKGTALIVAIGLAIMLWLILSTSDHAPAVDSGTVIFPVAQPSSRVPVVLPTSQRPLQNVSIDIADPFVRTHPDVALLETRFAAQSADPPSASRAMRLQSQIGRMSNGAASFADLTVTCHPTLCRLSGSVGNAHSPASRADAFALLHHPHISVIGASERLEPGPSAILAPVADQTTFVAYLIEP
jgi:hypothetical protein